MLVGINGSGIGSSSSSREGRFDILLTAIHPLPLSSPTLPLFPPPYLQACHAVYCSQNETGWELARGTRQAFPFNIGARVGPPAGNGINLAAGSGEKPADTTTVLLIL